MRLPLLTILTVVTLASVAAARDIPGAAQSPAVEAGGVRTVVFVEHTGTDPAGAAYVKSLRTELGRSPSFQLATTEKDAAVLLVVVSVSPASTSGVASAVSIAYVANNEWHSLLGSSARFVGQDQAATMGRTTVDELKTVLEAYLPPVTR
jgi:hypothetical protein